MDKLEILPTSSLIQRLPDTTSTKIRIENILTLDEKFNDFLKILEPYKLKCIARNCSNFYYDKKENIDYERKETDAEHVCSTQKLSDYFLFTEEEFKDLDRLKVYELVLYHDDIEIDAWDKCMSDTEWRKNKSDNELSCLENLASKYPKKLQNRLIELDTEYRNQLTLEAKFVNAVDKMDALVHELQYPKDRWPKWFTEESVRKWFQPHFEYSPTFMTYFENIMKYLKINNYF